MKIKKTIISIALVFAIINLSGCWKTAEGDKVGVVVKCAREGWFIKTFECELIRGGMNNASGAFGKPFYFTAENSNDIPILEEALNDQKEVHIKYHQELLSLWRTETEDNSFLDSIEVK